MTVDSLLYEPLSDAQVMSQRHFAVPDYPQKLTLNLAPLAVKRRHIPS